MSQQWLRRVAGRLLIVADSSGMRKRIIDRCGGLPISQRLADKAAIGEQWSTTASHYYYYYRSGSYSHEQSRPTVLF